jgi:phosphate starvation-inducible PhoH-like protein
MTAHSLLANSNGGDDNIHNINNINNINNHFNNITNIDNEWKSYFEHDDTPFKASSASSTSKPSKPSKHFHKMKKVKYFPRSDNQINYVNALEDIFSPMVFGLGPAGTGKTLFACEVGIRALKSKHFDKLVITRPLVSVERENVGFLPGTMKDKMDPWTRPIIDVLNELLSKEDVENMIKSGVIEISPLAYMRGRTFKNSWIIADEMQNSTPNQMKMLTTRIGDGSKMVINGDLNQSDLYDDNGLSDILNRIRDFSHDKPHDKPHDNPHDKPCSDSYDNIHLIELTNLDIQRSPIVAKLLRIYHYLDDSTPTCHTKSKNSDAALMPSKDILDGFHPPA